MSMSLAQGWGTRYQKNQVEGKKNTMRSTKQSRNGHLKAQVGRKSHKGSRGYEDFSPRIQTKKSHYICKVES